MASEAQEKNKIKNNEKYNKNKTRGKSKLLWAEAHSINV